MDTLLRDARRDPLHRVAPIVRPSGGPCACEREDTTEHSAPQNSPVLDTLQVLTVLLTTHLLYWVLTHPVNNFWLADFEMKGFGAGFFTADPFRRANGDRTTKPDWTVLRDRWERSHVARAVLAMLSLILLIIAVVR